MQACICACMITALFTFTAFHDLVINVAGAFGLLLCILTLWTLFQYKFLYLFFWGLCSIALIGTNNVLYHTGQLSPLPAVQKITFVCVMGWVTAICLALMRHKQSTQLNKII